MIRIYGVSDDLIEIEKDDSLDEIGCFDTDVLIKFDDGTEIRAGYGKLGLGIWRIVVETEGEADYELTECFDEDADIYSDIFEIDANIASYIFMDD